jgi:putative transposase
MQDYVLACYRYIELNPVRAGMVNRPQDYRWSSYHVNALGKADGLITPQGEYLQLARHDSGRREAYRALFKAHFEAATANEIRNATNGNFALGSGRFQKQIEEALGQRAQRGRSGRPRAAMRRRPVLK